MIDLNLTLSKHNLLVLALGQAQQANGLFMYHFHSSTTTYNEMVPWLTTKLDNYANGNLGNKLYQWESGEPIVLMGIW